MKLLSLILILIHFAFPAIAEEFKNGDMIFHTSKSSQMGAVFRATRSTFTHVGIIEVDKNGNKWVIEAIGPVTRKPFDQWVKEGIGDKYAVHRKSGITKEQGEKVVEKAKEFWKQKLPYDKQFSFDNGSKTYCSELVEMAYKAADLKIGKRQKISELSLSGAQIEKLLNERWKEHPACKGAKALKDCVDKVLDSYLISPYGLTMTTDESSTEEVFSNFTYADAGRAYLGIPPKRPARR